MFRAEARLPEALPSAADQIQAASRAPSGAMLDASGGGHQVPLAAGIVQALPRHPQPQDVVFAQSAARAWAAEQSAGLESASGFEVGPALDTRVEGRFAA